MKKTNNEIGLPTPQLPAPDLDPSAIVMPEIKLATTYADAIRQVQAIDRELENTRDRLKRRALQLLRQAAGKNAFDLQQGLSVAVQPHPEFGRVNMTRVATLREQIVASLRK